MEESLRLIVEAVKSGSTPSAHQLDLLLRAQNKLAHDPDRGISKKSLLPFYLRERERRTSFYESLDVDEATHDALVALLRAKPRRTASGVATITVLTKPWPCGGDCLYCPSDVRMPKSYLSDEPACQRAERCFFDPYLQVVSRLRVLEDMGHNTDKVELIVLGGTFTDYPAEYQSWYVKELFRSLNEFSTERCKAECEARRGFYRECGIYSDPEFLSAQSALVQRLVDSGEATYNQVVAKANDQSPWKVASLSQKATDQEVRAAQEANEGSSRRNVGLVFETRPELVTSAHLERLRFLGCTKVQIGVQSLDPDVLKANCRSTTIDDISRAFALLRQYGFKSHVHFMVNLLGSTPEKDKDGYLELMQDERYKPDEVKLYPCALVESSRLMECYKAGEWRPYTEEELLDVLSFAVLRTPPYTRISRMIRDISSTDIVAGNRKTNLRQMVELAVSGQEVSEMRMREIATDELDSGALHMEEVAYETSNTSERFLQWVTPEGRLAAFLRLSLPNEGETAMIREVHVYGKAARLHESKEGAQHAGLGRALIGCAEEIARQARYRRIDVISAVGTRNYYRSLGFEDSGLYQSKEL